MLKDEVKRCVLSGTGNNMAGHHRENRCTRRRPAEQHKGDEPWAALMIPHCGGDTQRDNRFIKPHAGGYRETYQRGETDNVGLHAVRIRFYTSSTAHGRYTHSRLGGQTTGRAESARLALGPPDLCDGMGAHSIHYDYVADTSHFRGELHQPILQLGASYGLSSLTELPPIYNCAKSPCQSRRLKSQTQNDGMAAGPASRPYDTRHLVRTSKRDEKTPFSLPSHDHTTRLFKRRPCALAFLRAPA